MMISVSLSRCMYRTKVQVEFVGSKVRRNERESFVRSLVGRLLFQYKLRRGVYNSKENWHSTAGGGYNFSSLQPSYFRKIPSWRSSSVPIVFCRSHRSGHTFFISGFGIGKIYTSLGGPETLTPFQALFFQKTEQPEGFR
jgi:hypothetical protein